jgi:hypothetical protein
MVEGVDHPVAVLPDRSGSVDVEPVRVGIPGQVEPEAAPALSIVRRRQQPIDEPLVGFGLVVSDERVDFRDTWW